jgi:hypothetical protein
MRRVIFFVVLVLLNYSAPLGEFLARSLSCALSRVFVNDSQPLGEVNIGPTSAKSKESHPHLQISPCSPNPVITQIHYTHTHTHTHCQIIHTHTHTHTHHSTYRHINPPPPTHAPTNEHTYKHIYKQGGASRITDTHTHKHTQTHTHTHTHTINTYAHKHLSTHIPTHAHTHISRGGARQ